MKIENPDKRRIYHVWHYCKVCGRAWTHSQSDAYEIKRHVYAVHKGDWSVIGSASTKTEYVEVVR